MSNIIDIRTRRPVEASAGPRTGRIVVTNAGPQTRVRIIMTGCREISRYFSTYEKAIWYAAGCAKQHSFSLVDLVANPSPSTDGGAA